MAGESLPRTFRPSYEERAAHISALKAEEKKGSTFRTLEHYGSLAITYGGVWTNTSLWLSGPGMIPVGAAAAGQLAYLIVRGPFLPRKWEKERLKQLAEDKEKGLAELDRLWDEVHQVETQWIEERAASGRAGQEVPTSIDFAHNAAISFAAVALADSAAQAREAYEAADRSDAEDMRTLAEADILSAAQKIENAFGAAGVKEIFGSRDPLSKLRDVNGQIDPFSVSAVAFQRAAEHLTAGVVGGQNVMQLRPSVNDPKAGLPAFVALGVWASETASDLPNADRFANPRLRDIALAAQQTGDSTVLAEQAVRCREAMRFVMKPAVEPIEAAPRTFNVISL